MNDMKRIFAPCIAAALALTCLSGCGGNKDEIVVLSREEGSGTRGAFVELLGIETKDEKGEKWDNTAVTADVTNSTSVMLTSVSQNVSAIGYVSLGSMNSSVKGLAIDGAAPTAENIESGEYSVTRPFNICVMEDLSAQARDLIDFILSAQGQSVVADMGYIPVADTGDYKGSPPTGKVTVAGSSSVAPVMEKLIEAYAVLNPDMKIELQTSDSTTGANTTIEGVCDIGMASRELTDSELSKGLTPTVIARDGIVVIVNPQCPVDGLSSEQVRQVYTGETKLWSELAQQSLGGTYGRC